MTESVQPTPASPKKAATKLSAKAMIGVGLFAVALVLRLLGIGWGLKNDLHNQSYHPDETLIWAYSQQIDPTSGHFTPGFYNYGTLYLTVLRVATDVTGAYTGRPDPRDPNATWSFVSRCNLAGRIISAFAGAGTVLVVFLMLRRFLGEFGAAAAAAVILVAPAHVVHSRFQTVDVFATFLLAVSACYALRLIPLKGEDIEAKLANRCLILSALFAGLSAGTKYTGILGLLTLIAVLVMCRRKTMLKDGAIALVVAAVAFVIATPGCLLDTDKFLRDVGFEMAHTSQGHGLVFAGTASGYLYNFANLMSGIGSIMLCIAVGGLGWAAYRKHKWAIALLACFIPYYIVLGGATDKYMRYTFPLYIAIAAGFGYAVAAGHRKQGTGIAVVLAGIMGIGGAIDSRGLIGAGRETLWMMREDPRDEAARYLKTQAAQKPDEVVGLASDPWYWSPPLFLDSTCMRSVPFTQRMMLMSAADHPKAAYYIPPDGLHHPFDDRLITQLHPDVIAISSLETIFRERLSRQSGLTGEAAAAAEQYLAFTKALKENYEPDQTFGEAGDGVEDMQYVQPTVWIWKRKK